MRQEAGSRHRRQKGLALCRAVAEDSSAGVQHRRGISGQKRALELSFPWICRVPVLLPAWGGQCLL